MEQNQQQQHYTIAYTRKLIWFSLNVGKICRKNRSTFELMCSFRCFFTLCAVFTWKSKIVQLNKDEAHTKRKHIVKIFHTTFQ